MSCSGAGRWVGRQGLAGRWMGRVLGVGQGSGGRELERDGRIQGKVKGHRELVGGRRGSLDMLVIGSHGLDR